MIGLQSRFDDFLTRTMKTVYGLAAEGKMLEDEFQKVCEIKVIGSENIAAMFVSIIIIIL